MTDKSTDDDHRLCNERLRLVEEENQHLREAARTFAQLAERINAKLQEQRATQRLAAPPGLPRRRRLARLNSQ